MTNWVTVKVPEPDRNQAATYKPDGVTWGDCLVAGAERLNDTVDSDVSVDATVTPVLDEDAVDEMVDELVERMDGYDVDVHLDESDFADMVVSDLVAQLPPRIAEELR